MRVDTWPPPGGFSSRDHRDRASESEHHMSSIRNPNTHKHLLAMSRTAVLSVASRAAQPQAVQTLSRVQRIARLEVLQAEVAALLALEGEGEELPSQEDDDEAF